MKEINDILLGLKSLFDPITVNLVDRRSYHFSAIVPSINQIVRTTARHVAVITLLALDDDVILTLGLLGLFGAYEAHNYQYKYILLLFSGHNPNNKVLSLRDYCGSSSVVPEFLYCIYEVWVNMFLRVSVLFIFPMLYIQGSKCIIFLSSL